MCYERIGLGIIIQFLSPSRSTPWVYHCNAILLIIDGNSAPASHSSAIAAYLRFCPANLLCCIMCRLSESGRQKAFLQIEHVLTGGLCATQLLDS